MTYQQKYEKLIKRMKRDSSRYNALNTKTDLTPNEEKIVALCRYFTFNAGDMYTTSEVSVRNDLDPLIAGKKINDLEKLLNEEGWE